MTVVYEDNHIIVVNKTASEIVQADKTGDTPLSETVKQYLKEKYQKPGNVFLMTAALSDEVRAEWAKKIPLRRGGTPEDVANIATFLASDMSSYVSGQVIQVDGGMNM